jgi:hypothetical protein
MPKAKYPKNWTPERFAKFERWLANPTDPNEDDEGKQEFLDWAGERALEQRKRHEAKEAARQAYIDSTGYEEPPYKGFLQCFSPKAWSAWHWATNRLMTVVIIVCLAEAVNSLITGKSDRVAAIFMLLTPCIMARYAPLYTVVGMVPYWFLYAAVDGFIYGNNNSWRRVMAWFLVWSLYPLLKGLWHIKGWEQERKFGLPLHPVSEHPYAVAAACIGTAAAVRHFSKK